MARRRSRIEGIDRLTRRLRYFDDQTRVELGDTIEDLSNEVRDYARGYAVQYSRFIPAQIQARTDKNALGARIGLISSFARKMAWYAHFIEWGTKPSRKTAHPGLPARPFLYAAWWQISPKFEPRVKALVEKLIAEGFRPGRRR